MNILFFFPPLVQIEDELFNPDYVEVDRIMDFARSTDDRGEVTEDHLYSGAATQTSLCVLTENDHGILDLVLVRALDHGSRGLNLTEIYGLTVSFMTY